MPDAQLQGQKEVGGQGRTEWTWGWDVKRQCP